MNYIIDTHIIIWLAFEPEKISANVKKILTNTSNNIYFSSVNFWEISIKHASGKLSLSRTPEELYEALIGLGYIPKNLTVLETLKFYRLTALHHQDPFDRMLIWQALENDYTLISDDKNIKKYKDIGLKVAV